MGGAVAAQADVGVPVLRMDERYAGLFNAPYAYSRRIALVECVHLCVR
jgi:hypothetical protein